MTSTNSDLTLSHIVAVSENGVIGRAGSMPWHIPEDFKFFKKTTMGHPMIMGRKTWDSIGRALPGRQTIVVSRSWSGSIPENVVVKPTIEDALVWCEGEKSVWGKEVFVVGGGEIYRQTLALVDQIYMTTVHREIDGDVFYPKIDRSEFVVTLLQQDLKNSSPYTIELLVRPRN